MLARNTAQHNKVKKNLWFLRRMFSHKISKLKYNLFDLSKMISLLKYEWKVNRKIRLQSLEFKRALREDSFPRLSQQSLEVNLQNSRKNVKHGSRQA
jgi:ABC-type transport system involved in Fe-S cluster assembly fused permease/ATPase subunit